MTDEHEDVTPTLLDVHDTMNKARRLVEAILLISEAMDRTFGDPIATVAQEAKDGLERAGGMLDSIRGASS